ncbi:MAG TPA: protease pro-enzyme activation domain-containing protein [Terracidiphilus sp.]|nr:protease pro-enzyme activation domain-containing protein [Terracidiphilus sp.]
MCNRIATGFAAALAFTALLAATAHAQVAPSASTPAGYTGATPLEVMNGQATLAGHLPAAQKLRLVLGLQPPHMAEEEAFLVDLQTKGSPNFHKYPTPEEWNARFAPAAEDEQKVVDWAQSQGLSVTHRYANRLIVDVEGTSDVVEKAFAVQMNQYKLATGVEFSNDRDPVIPGHLVGILHSVGGLNSIQRVHAPHEGSIQDTSAMYSPLAQLPVSPGFHADGNRAAYDAAVKANQERAGTDNSVKLMAGAANSGGNPTPGVTNGFIDPTDVYSSYGYDYGALQNQGHCCNPFHVAGGSPPATSIGIATAGAFANSDIVGFSNQYPYLAYNINAVWIDGTPTCCNDETTLDTEWAMATANSFGSYLDTSHVWVYEGANNLLSTFTDIYNQMLSDGHARIFSTSWGCAENACATGSYMDTNHAIFNSMLGQGWTIMALSHDYGATGACDNALRVTYPGSDPDAISVGGTSLALFNDGTFSSETAWSGGHSAGSCGSNDGGSGGGCSAHFGAPGYQSSPYCGAGSRSVPDLALNAGYGQNYYFAGALRGVGGTSISTPQVAGFMAQENAYLMAIGTGCGAGFASTCSPMGDPHGAIYRQGYTPSSSTHVPFYDITSGCNSNDITDLYGLGYYCAGAGYDAITGWGSFNALQLSWAISSFYSGGYSNPTVAFSGPTVSTGSYTWFHTDQTIGWTITANACCGYVPTGIAGYSNQWDASFSDPTSEAHQGTGNLFYSGPAVKNTNTGSVLLSSAGQGCHYLTVYGFDNTGFVTGNQYYYWICYDTIVPTITIATNPVTSGTVWVNHPVTVTLTATDPGSSASGIYRTYYAANTGACFPGSLAACTVYSAPFTISTPGQTYVYYWTQDNAGNVSGEPYQWISIDEIAPVSKAALAGTIYSGTTYKTAVNVSLSASDAGGSGLKHTFYKLDGGAQVTYAAAFTVSTLGSHTVTYWSTDNAGNTEVAKTVSFSIVSPTTAALVATPNPSVHLQSVTMTATITATVSGTPTGSVIFYNGATNLGSGTLSGGVATLSTTALPLGALTLQASYAGSGNFLASNSAPFNQTVNKATPTVSPWPTASTITYGQTLGSSTLTGGTASVPGTFAWSAPSIVPHAGVQSRSVTFTPTDTTNYNSVIALVTITVNKATPTVSTWPTASNIPFGQTLGSSTLTGGTASVPGTFAWSLPSIVPHIGVQSRNVTFTPTDTTNYNTTSGYVTITVIKGTPTVSTWPTGSAITFGQTLAASTLTGGTASVPGTFAWTVPSIVPHIGVQSRSVTFTPTDTTDYNTVSGYSTVTVNKATPTVSTWPTASTITFGQTLASSTLTGGAASVAGTFAWSAPSIAPHAGVQSRSVTFTPTDTTDYNTVIGLVTITVNKATPTITWATPAPITHGTALSGTQLDASSSVAGTFVYSPAAGTVLAAGSHTLSVTLTPTDTADYNTASASVSLTVN